MFTFASYINDRKFAVALFFTNSLPERKLAFSTPNLRYELGKKSANGITCSGDSIDTLKKRVIGIN